MNLSGFFSGFNTMGEALNNERIQRLRGGLLQGQFDDETKARKERDQVQASVATALNGDQTAPQPVMPEPPAMAAQGVLPPPAPAAPSVVGAPMGVIQGDGVMQGVGNSAGDPTATAPAPAIPPASAPAAAPVVPTNPMPAAQPSQPAQSVTITAQKPDKVAEALKAARDSWAKIGNVDKAAEMDVKLGAHFGSKLTQSRSEFELANTGKTNALASADLSHRIQQNLMTRLGFVANAKSLGADQIAVDGINSINEDLGKTGRPMWNPAVKVASIRNVLDPKTGQSNVTPLDADGNPVTGQNGQVLHFTTDQWAKLGNVAANTKLEKIKPGEQVFVYDERSGSMKPVASGGPAPEGAEKATFITGQVHKFEESLRHAFGATTSPDGQTRSAGADPYRMGEYLKTGGALIRQGVPYEQVFAMLNEHRTRDMATKSKFSPNDLQDFVRNYGNRQSPRAPAAAAAPSPAAPVPSNAPAPTRARSVLEDFGIRYGNGD